MPEPQDPDEPPADPSGPSAWEQDTQLPYGPDAAEPDPRFSPPRSHHGSESDDGSPPASVYSGGIHADSIEAEDEESDPF
eukprot:5444887-Prorocentrum_lima.AAC.1